VRDGTVDVALDVDVAFVGVRANYNLRPRRVESLGLPLEARERVVISSGPLKIWQRKPSLHVGVICSAV
jgi:hypothetical protein